MEALNGRLIINEDELEEACNRIERLITTKLNLLSLPEKVCCCAKHGEDTDNMWNDIYIILGYEKDDECFAHIMYATESLSPTLVHKDGQFQFYHVYEVAHHTCTNARTLNNDLKKGDKILEEILIDELNLKASKLTLINNLLKQ